MKQNNFYFWIALMPTLLMITSCGSNSTGVVTQTSPTYTLFQSAQGGIIFYLDGTKSHGLAAALADLPTQLQWDTNADGFTGAILTGLSEGFQDTSLMIKALGSKAQVASGCTGYSSPFSGWYLPSLQELNELYFLQTSIGTVFDDTAAYWSSTESATTPSQAMVQVFAAGGQNQFAADKTSSASVRCIRAF